MSRSDETQIFNGAIQFHHYTNSVIKAIVENNILRYENIYFMPLTSLKNNIFRLFLYITAA